MENKISKAQMIEELNEFNNTVVDRVVTEGRHEYIFVKTTKPTSWFESLAKDGGYELRQYEKLHSCYVHLFSKREAA